MNESLATSLRVTEYSSEDMVCLTTCKRLAEVACSIDCDILSHRIYSPLVECDVRSKEPLEVILVSCQICRKDLVIGHVVEDYVEI